MLRKARPPKERRRGGRGRDAPLSSEVLGQDTDEALERAHDGPVDHDRLVEAGARGIAVARAGILEVEVFRQLEVKLDRRHLVLALERVRDGNVDLGAVKLREAGDKRRVS